MKREIYPLNNYKSPIDIRTFVKSGIEKIASEISEDNENRIYNLLSELEITVDKRELIKALKYDRDQYEKGYKYGYETAYKQAQYKISTEIIDFIEIEIKKLGKQTTKDSFGERPLLFYEAAGLLVKKLREIYFGDKNE